MNILEIIRDYLYVPKCASCRTRMNKNGNGLCDKCLIAYKDAKEDYCDFCGMAVYICRCLPSKMSAIGCVDYRKLVFYKNGGEFNPVRSIIYAIKRRYNIALMKYFAKELFDIDGNIDTDTIVTFPPRSVKSKKQYGYDHAEIIAKYYSEISGSKFVKLFHRKRMRCKEQKTLDYSQRAVNVKGAFVLYNASIVKDKNIVLIDDVVTSGATISECADILYKEGAKNVICRSIGYTYRKNKHKKD